MNAVIYIHGKGGSPNEAEHYAPLFPLCRVIGLDYKASTPWEAGGEIRAAVAEVKAKYDDVALIANSVGAFYAMCADIEAYVSRAYFISPIVDMEALIADMMSRAGVTERELREKGVVRTDFGEELSWEYLAYVREHPVAWSVPTDILYGSEDNLTSIDAVTDFARKHGAGLTVMNGGEHWFHTPSEMRFLDGWIRGKRFCKMI